MDVQNTADQSFDPLNEGVEKALDICGGSACIAGTRIPIWSLITSKKLGFSDQELLQNYPTLNQTDLNNAWSYFILYKAEIENEIKENDEIK